MVKGLEIWFQFQNMGIVHFSDNNGKQIMITTQQGKKTKGGGDRDGTDTPHPHPPKLSQIKFLVINLLCLAQNFVWLFNRLELSFKQLFHQILDRRSSLWHFGIGNTS